MAGMLPGVEAARRRRIHQSSSSNNSTSNSISSISSLSSRRSYYSLFSTNSSASSLMQGQTRSRTYEEEDEENRKLGLLAREAKERLDAKLRTQPNKSHLFTRNNSNQERMNSNKSHIVIRGQLKREVYGRRNKNGKRGWKWKSKSSSEEEEDEECAVCLDELRVGDDILKLECHHTFHETCLLPWLHTNAHCPCCRLPVFNH